MQRGGFLADGAVVFVRRGRVHIVRLVQAEIIRVLPTAGGNIGVYLRAAFSQYQHLLGAGSSVDRARRSQRRGQRFDPAPVHHFVSMAEHGRTEEDRIACGDHFE